MNRNILVGFAIGDALGMPFECEKFGSKRLKEWDGKTYQPSSYHNLKPGETTDDTSMCLALADSIIENYSVYNKSEYSVDLAAKHYLNWFLTNPVGSGKTTIAAMKNLQNGISPNSSGIILSESVSGNGPAMRIPAMSIFLANFKVGDSKTLKQHRDLLLSSYVMSDSTITHVHPKLTTYYAALEYATTLLSFIEKDSYPILWDYTKNQEYNLKAKVLMNFGFNNTWEETSYFLSCFNGFGIVDTVCSALYIAEYVKSDYLKGLEMAIRIGGDTDTRAALVGALVVAKHGCETIPQYLIDQLANKDKIIKTEELLSDIKFI